MINTFFLLFMTSSLYAASLGVVNQPYQYQDAPEYLAMMAVLKSYGDFTVKSKEEVNPVGPKKLSRGQQMIEKAKARNRAILAQRTKDDKLLSERKEKLSGPELWREEVKRTYAAWRKEIQETRKQWQKEQDIFLGRIKVYQENTFEIPVKKEKIIEKKIITSTLPEVHIVNGAFEVPIRDQKNRPTCSAFAGVRALEIILAQNKRENDLSEQYFYWASKPKCHTSPCSEKGSWVGSGFRYSKGHPDIDIPLETTCAYTYEGQPRNETQIPLSSDCRLGRTKVTEYSEARTLADVVEKLKKDVPVVMAAKLTPNFYRNKGLVTLEDSKKDLGLKLDGHAQGHAFIAIGIMELPEKLTKKEGHYCLVVANSWGRGWGAGGYSCLTENWLLKYRQPSPFLAVTKLSVR